jgi:hypothetical protein
MSGRGLLLPKDVQTLWKTMSAAHEDMTAKVSYEKVEIEVPQEVICVCPFVFFTTPLNTCTPLKNV